MLSHSFAACRAFACVAAISIVHALGQVDSTVQLAGPQLGGLSASDWSSIKIAYEAARYAAYPVEGGYLARNPGQCWRSRFDGRGFESSPDSGPNSDGWSWGLDLIGYGRGDDVRVVLSPASVDVQGSRVAYRWDTALTEWFINDRRGLEHGYTIHERPANPRSAPLRLVLAVRGELCPQISAEGRDVAFVDATGTVKVSYTGLSVSGADGCPVPARFDPAPEGLGMTIDDAGALYPLTIDPIAQRAYLKASNIDSSDYFGSAVAVYGDTVVVGAPGEDSNSNGINGNQADETAPDSGAAYVFVRNGTAWTQQAYLKASNSLDADYFGSAVALSGDTLVVGAPFESSNARGVNGTGNYHSSFSGAAYVFVRNGAVWTQQAYVKASNTGVDNYFGYSVALSGDTLVVGAFGEASNATGVNGNQADSSAPLSGAAYVFARIGNVWAQQAYLKASNSNALDYFGASVAVSGDTAVVAAPYEDSGATGVNGSQADETAMDAGAAYVFVRTGTAWAQQAYLKASNTDPSDSFGFSVAVLGDTVAVGAAGESSGATGVNGNQADNGTPASGAAYVFARAGTVWNQQAYLKASNTGVSDSFGWSIAMGADTVVVGAVGEASNSPGVNGNQADNSEANSGAAYVFARSGSAWSQLAYLKASNPAAGSEFGWGVAAFGDTVVSGSPFESGGAAESGACYFFDGVAACVSPAVTTQPVGQTTCVGAAVVQSVEAGGSGPLAYQWRKDGSPLADGGAVSGATAPTLTIDPAIHTDAGNYDCLITNGCGSVLTDAAALTICVADYNCDTFVSGDDFDSFVLDFYYGNPAADVNRDTFVSGDDFDLFVDRFVAGC